MIGEIPLAELEAQFISPPTVTASLTAVLDGQLLPTNTPVTCQACGETLREGSQIIVEQTPPVTARESRPSGRAGIAP